MRTRKPGRLRAIGISARVVFTRQGFRLTQMADVAREAGLSAGALYSYVDGKEALLELALAEAVGDLAGPPGEADRFVAEGLAVAAARMRDRIVADGEWRALNSGLGAAAVTSDALAAAVAELFDWLGARRHLIWLLDRVSPDVPALNDIYQDAVRRRYFTDFARLIARAAGEGGAAGAMDGDAAMRRGRALLEMTVWMAMHRHRDRLPPPGDDAAARATAIEIVLASVAAWRDGGLPDVDGRVT